MKRAAPILRKKKTDIERCVCIPRIYPELYAILCDSLKGTPDITGDFIISCGLFGKLRVCSLH